MYLLNKVLVVKILLPSLVSLVLVVPTTLGVAGQTSKENSHVGANWMQVISSTSSKIYHFGKINLTAEDFASSDAIDTILNVLKQSNQDKLTISENDLVVFADEERRHWYAVFNEELVFLGHFDLVDRSAESLIVPSNYATLLDEERLNDKTGMMIGIIQNDSTSVSNNKSKETEYENKSRDLLFESNRWTERHSRATDLYVKAVHSKEVPAVISASTSASEYSTSVIASATAKPDPKFPIVQSDVSDLITNYTIANGDRLWNISRKVYGRVSQDVIEYVLSNNPQIKSPESLNIGDHVAFYELPNSVE